jgi:alcohol dehydrogenase class IV
MSHSLGGYLDLAHGECNAILLDRVMEFNHAAVPERFDRIAEAMGIDIRGMTTPQKRSALIHAIQKLKHAVGIDRHLGQIGVSPGDLPVLSGKAVKDACLLTNPRPANKRDIEVIYGEAL